MEGFFHSQLELDQHADDHGAVRLDLHAVVVAGEQVSAAEELLERAEEHLDHPPQPIHLRDLEITQAPDHWAEECHQDQGASSLSSQSSSGPMRKSRAEQDWTSAAGEQYGLGALGCE